MISVDIGDNILSSQDVQLCSISAINLCIIDEYVAAFPRLIPTLGIYTDSF